MFDIPQVEPWLDQREADAAKLSVESNWISEGPNCKEFSEQLRQLIGSPFGVFAPNGTLALSLALMALDIGPGDEVLIPNTTFIGSANAVILAGAVPVFVDVDNKFFQIDIVAAKQKLTGKTRAIMPVHLYGTACDMYAVRNFAGNYNLKIIEDSAQGIGVSHKGQHVGGFGDAGCFSFFADKTITTGEGGFVVCSDEKIYENLKYLRNQGRLSAGTFVHPMKGYNFRITDVQAAIGLAQLSKLGEIIEKKSKIFNWYLELLDDHKNIRILGTTPESTHVPFRCVLISTDAHELMAHLNEKGVQSRSFFYPMHRQPCFSTGNLGLSEKEDDYANSIYGYENGLCLPIFPTLRREHVEYISKIITEFYR